MKKFYFQIFMLSLALQSIQVMGQADSSKTSLDSSKTENYLELSLEDLMDVKIVSASRKEESAFEAPLSSCVITRQEILNMAATSIPDALKICPGLIVREHAPGSYDVSIRGGIDGVPTYQYTYTNSSILVMIDNRPVFNNLSGGTYWANLPIGIVDIERIEVVNSASSPLFGPNAVSGVINIITRKFTKKGLNASANVQAGVPNALISSVLVGYKFNDKIDFGLSGNHTDRQRYFEDYLSDSTRKYGSFNDYSTANRDRRNFPLGNKSLIQTGANFYFNFNPTSKIKFFVTGGHNESKNIVPLNVGSQATTFKNINNSIYLKGSIYNFNIQASYLNGLQSLLGDRNGFKYKYKTTDIYVDYNFSYKDVFSLRPALSFQRAFINDLPYTVERGFGGVFQNKAYIDNYAASLKADYIYKNTKLIAAVRLDKFTYPNKIYPSYQFIINQKFNDNAILRLVVARSFKGSYLGDVFVNFVGGTIPANPSSPLPTNIYVRGNKDLNLVRNDMVEAGLRAKLTENIQFDLAIYRQEFSNFNAGIIQLPYPEFANSSPIPTNLALDIKGQNLPLKVIQNGASIYFQVNMLENKLQIKPNITIQQTELIGYTRYYIEPNFNPVLNINTRENNNANYTPKIYGGLYANYLHNKKLNINLGGYAFDSYSLTTNFMNPTANLISSYTPAPADPQESLIKRKIMINLSVGYKVAKGISTFVSGRNILNADSREGFGTDKIGYQVTLGVNYDY